MSKLKNMFFPKEPYPKSKRFQIAGTESEARRMFGDELVNEAGRIAQAMISGPAADEFFGEPIDDHRFTVRRQDGIGPHLDSHPCKICGKPKSQHATGKVLPNTVSDEVFGKRVEYKPIRPAMVSEYLRRLIDEEAALSAKIDTLGRFINDDRNHVGLLDSQIEKMSRKIMAMGEYQKVLREQISEEFSFLK